MDSAYFDSSVFLAIFKGEDSGHDIKALLRELRRDKVRICTSIITVQEVSVAAFLFGGAQTDNYSKVERLARIHGVGRDIALHAAKLEAKLVERQRKMGREEQQKISPRRKFDCFHIATALEMRCRWLYTLDPGLIKCGALVEAPASLTFTEPKPRTPDLFPGR